MLHNDCSEGICDLESRQQQPYVKRLLTMSLQCAADGWTDLTQSGQVICAIASAAKA